MSEAWHRKNGRHFVVEVERERRGDEENPRGGGVKERGNKALPIEKTY